MKKYKKNRYTFKKPMIRMDKGTVLSSNLIRDIELTFPIFIGGSAATYPAGSTTYAAFYYFIRNGAVDSTSVIPIFSSLLTTDYAQPGASREYLDLSKVYSLVTVRHIDVAFVRSYVSSTDISNLPCLSLNVKPCPPPGYTLGSGSYVLNTHNYSEDGSCYWQVVNSDKLLSAKRYLVPNDHVINAPNSLTAGGFGNSWTSVSSLVDSPICLTIGQNLPCVTPSASESYIRIIGAAMVKVQLEFASPTAVA